MSTQTPLLNPCSSAGAIPHIAARNQWQNGRFSKLITITGILTLLLGLASFMQSGPATEPFTLAVALMFLLLIIVSVTTKKNKSSTSITLQS